MGRSEHIRENGFSISSTKMSPITFESEQVRLQIQMNVRGALPSDPNHRANCPIGVLRLWVLPGFEVSFPWRLCRSRSQHHSHVYVPPCS
jgi:hypothetical protein